MHVYAKDAKVFSVVFAALVFNTDSADNETIPRYVSYKIRMDIDRVDSTTKFKVTDRCAFTVLWVCVCSVCFLFLISSLYMCKCMYV